MNNPYPKPSKKCNPLTEVIEQKAIFNPQDICINFISFKEQDEIFENTLTNTDLYEDAVSIAALLQKQGAKKGDRAMLLYPSGLDYIKAFFGCLFAGVIAVPAYPPFPAKMINRLVTIIDDSKAKYFLTISAYIEIIQLQFKDKRSQFESTCKIVDTSYLNRNVGKREFRPVDINKNTIAFLQYTSGSTSKPKGVIITHENLLDNLEYILRSFEHNEESHEVSWLPPYHDMGLIGGILQPLYGNFRTTLMSPMDFLQKPFRWLQAITIYKATTSGGPNFSFDLCTRKINQTQLEILDLSTWSIAFNGAEPIRAETIEKFSSKFRVCGFNEETFYPCYGLAESTLMVSGGIKDALPEIKKFNWNSIENHKTVCVQNDGISKQLVSVGNTFVDNDILIVDPNSKIERRANEIGEIWTKGSSVAKGYWNNLEKTKEVFEAYTSDGEKGPYLRTGDLGFIRKGELFITGRLKDVIIIRGRNIYPQDIEKSIETLHPSFRLGCSATFYTEIKGEEKLCVVQEIKKSDQKGIRTKELIELIRKKISRTHNLNVYAVTLLPQGTIPKTSSGKIQRYACKEGFLQKKFKCIDKWENHSILNRETNLCSEDESFKADKAKQKIQDWLVYRISEKINISLSEIDINDPFDIYGMNSVDAVNITGELQDWLMCEVPPTVLYDYPNIHRLALHLSEISKKSDIETRLNKTKKTENEDIAVIGIGCRFPGKVKNTEDFWNLLINEKDAIIDFRNHNIQEEEISESVCGIRNGYFGGYLDDKEKFDAEFFKITRREAEYLDPQQRLLLETSWESLEHAGIIPSTLVNTRTGVFIGISNNDYLRLQAGDSNHLTPFSATGNSFSIAANRISYFYDLKGPSYSIDTACSSSLVAVHLACNNLKLGECDLAFAGGVNLIFSMDLTNIFTKAGMIASDGRCKSFDVSANGYVRGEGCGLVLLKRLADAKRDGNRILAIVKGSATNQDGKTNGLATPNGPSQQEVIRQSLKNAGVSPNNIGYVETHGTGTSLGDPIEVNSLQEVLMKGSKRDLSCYIGSVKSNIGHLEAAAGIAGLIKTILILYYKKIPPNLNYKKRNPYITIKNNQLLVPQRVMDWRKDSSPRYASVSSFGFGGTNAHLILEEYVQKNRLEKNREQSSKIFILSAKNEDRLIEYIKLFLLFLHNDLKKQDSDMDLTNILYTLQTGRESMADRLAVIVSNKAELYKKLHKYYNGEENIAQLYKGHINRKNIKPFIKGEEGKDLIRNLVKNKKLEKLALLWVNGINVDWNLFYPGHKTACISLPTYPFKKEPYWLPKYSKIPLNQKNKDMYRIDDNNSGLYNIKKSEMNSIVAFKPIWEKTNYDNKFKALNGNLLIFDINENVFNLFKNRYGNDFRNILLVKTGSKFRYIDNQIFEIHPENQKDYRKLIATLKNENRLPDYIIHLWVNGRGVYPEKFETEIYRELYSIFNISKELLQHSTGDNVRLLHLFQSHHKITDPFTIPFNRAVSGFCRSVSQENPKFIYKNIQLSNDTSITKVVDFANTEFRSDIDFEVFYHKNHRYVKRLTEINLKNSLNSIAGKHGNSIHQIKLKEKGVYLITGGAGTLGFSIAKHIRKKLNANLVLIGRSEAPTKMLDELKEMGSPGSNIHYIKADISERRGVEVLIKKIKATYETINGIFHCAGIIKDSLLVNKSFEELRSVSDPKILGTIYLDEATKDEKLDFMLFFSSIVAVLGNTGQCDYAYANCFMDSFALMREMLKRKQMRFGNSISVNWPLWEEGKMQIPSEIRNYLADKYGLIPLGTSEGITVLNNCLNSELNQIVITYGDREKLISNINKKLCREVIERKNNVKKHIVPHEKLYEKTENILKIVFSKITKMPIGSIDRYVHFQEYGIDSIIVDLFNAEIENTIGAVPKTLLFEYPNLKDLTTYFVKNHRERLIDFIGKETDLKSGDNKSKKIENGSIAVEQKEKNIKQKIPQKVENEEKTSLQDIAIIGVSGRYPGADDLQVYWDNLRSGKDSITEIPIDRWDYKKYYDPDPEKGFMYCKWGGFIEDVDKFDPLFFNISNKEAELMDPQERLFLEYSWSAVEDSGYTIEDLKKNNSTNHKNVGVFVGATTNSYHLLGEEKWNKGNLDLPTSLPWSIANRVSFVFDFNGPSISIDTACSSSLTAIHLACQSIKNGDCGLAIAGGVNLYLHHSKYALLCLKKILSSKGRCSSFGENGDGFVPGEGVGAVILKPFSLAVEDGDHIYAVIKGSSINHGGRTNGYTVPSLTAQSNLISQLIKKSGINPRSISYIEAHGTGTRLGDPVEINGLTRAFSEFTLDKQFCSVGSVKSNIGHLESAAGIAGLTKVLLQLKYKEYAPSIHSSTLNSNINFESTPFYVQDKPREWKRPIIINNYGKKKEYPRRAGISSFGAGGANAHIFLEEYEEYRPSNLNNSNHTQIMVLSAKNDDRLKTYVKRLVDFIEKANFKNGKRIQNNKNEISIHDLAYTLQVGRKAMNERLALITNNIDDLVIKLTEFCSGKYPIEGLLKGNIKTNDRTKIVITEENKENYINRIIKNKDLNKLGQLWISGFDIDWKLLHEMIKVRRISLPTYPFIRERLWVSPPVNKEVIEDAKIEFNQSVLKTKHDSEYLNKKLHKSETLFYRFNWKKSEKNQNFNNLITGNLLIFDVSKERFNALKNGSLNSQNKKIVLVTPGNNFKKLEDQIYQINPESNEDYGLLISSLQKDNFLPDHILHLWSMLFDNSREVEFQNSKLKKYLINSIYSILYIINTIWKLKIRSLNRMLFVYNSDTDRSNPIFDAIAGYSKSIQFIYPNLSFSTLEILKQKNTDPLIDILLKELSAQDYCPEIRYEDNERMIRMAEKMDMTPCNFSNIRKGGVYLITGGTGAIGLLFAKYLAINYRAKIILVGRSERGNSLKGNLKALNNLGGETIYLQADVTNKGNMAWAIRVSIEKFKTLNGIIHAAGCQSVKPLTEKSVAEFEEILKPKINGTIVLDEVSKKLDLDFFIMFSSSASILGDFGQCDYAVANRFMDSFVRYREILRTDRKRPGRTLAINWPLWKEGGMHHKDNGESLYLKLSDMDYLENENGFLAFETILKTGHNQIMVIKGKPATIDSLFSERQNCKSKNNPKIHPKPPRLDRNNKNIIIEIEKKLQTLVSQILKIDTEKLHPDENFGNFGFDSVGLKDFAAQLCKEYGIDLSPTIFFNRSNLESLSEYLFETYKDRMSEYHTTGPIENKPITKISLLKSDQLNLFTAEQNKSGNDIAIIGIHGVFPGASCINGYWRNLKNEKDLITIIPKERWNWNDYADQYSKNVKWGGFIEDIDKFDASFFNISPREAEMMDPQHRLMLESIWKTIEDSGHLASEFSGRPVGVFIGVESNSYQQLLESTGKINAQMGTGNHHAMLVNRVSYFLNLKGPSETINTACSSSAVAIHRAVKSMQTGESELAFAGGVNLILSPYHLNVTNCLEVLSSDGRCKTFDKTANGYVKGEGIGTILLKPLEQALTDHDKIYAIIKGTAVNHGGKSTSLTAPNPQAQSDLLRNLYKKTGIDLSTVTYMEVHGTGTELGDPVEVDGLKSAFMDPEKANSSSVAPYCGLGSVKTNIGHLEAASGIASLIKVIMAMRHRLLPKTLHITELNPYIDLQNTPFYIVDQTRYWKRKKDKNKNAIPRRAGINSFGFGGTNVHIIVEEYDMLSSKKNENNGTPHLIVLSSKNKESLKKYIFKLITYLDNRMSKSNQSKQAQTHDEIKQNLIEIVSEILNIGLNEIDEKEEINNFGIDRLNLYQYLKLLKEKYQLPNSTNIFLENPTIELLADYIYKNQETTINEPSAESINLTDFSYTLQVGREPMNERVALVVSNFEELKRKLVQYNQGKVIIDNFYVGSIHKKNNKQGQKAEYNEDLELLTKRKDLGKLGKLWIKGITINWALLYNGNYPNRISLPTYAFDRKKYWYCNKEILCSYGKSPYKKKEKMQSTGSDKDSLAKNNCSLERGKEENYSEFKEIDSLEEGGLSPTISFGPYKIRKSKINSYNKNAIFKDKKIRFMESFVQNYCNKHRQSKSLAQEYRSVYADEKSANAFNMPLKELCFPLIAERAEGSNIWDIDGNKYIDISMDFGVNLFGHQPQFLKDALNWQINKGLPLSMRSESSLQAAKLLCELTKMERAIFTQSGSEAVMAAIRIARHVTNRKKIVLFVNSYHGNNDTVLAVPGKTIGEDDPKPLIRSIPQGIIEDVMVLEYGSNRSLEIIDNLGEKLAAVLVEPVQSRIIEVQPKKFLHALKDITRHKEIGLIFDEMITGFRVLPGGAQEWFDVEADIATYGKILGGGVGMGAIAGKSKYLDAIDGGSWNFGDDSYPKVERTFFAGTHAQNPLGMISAKTVLEFLKNHSPQLQIGLNQTCTDMCQQLNTFFHGEEIPLQALNFGSLFRINLRNNYRNYFELNLLNYLNRHKGVMVFESGNNFLSISHTREDVDKTVNVIKENVSELIEAGFFRNQKERKKINTFSGYKNSKSPSFEEEIIDHKKYNFKIKETSNHEFSEKLKATEKEDTHIDIYNGELTNFIKKRISDLLKIPDDDFEMDDDLNVLGVNSILGIELVEKLNEHLQINVSPTIIFSHNTGNKIVETLKTKYTDKVEQFCRKNFHSNFKYTTANKSSIETTPLTDNQNYFNREILPEHPSPRKKDFLTNKYPPVAIIGMSGITSNSDDLEKFWYHLANSRDATANPSYERWIDLQTENYGFPDNTTPKAGISQNAETFDSLFFHISPKEAETMDPRQRVLMETVWHTIEDAGYDASYLNGSNTGVYVGIEDNEYEKIVADTELSVPQSAAICMIANRISFFFNFHGASEVIDTSCTSSLFAMHRAVRSLHLNENDYAIAAGVSILYSPDKIIEGLNFGVISKDGICRPFDKKANGYIIGEGTGAVLLKPLSKAITENDHIYGVIKGSAVNHGGKASSLTAPNPEMQTAVIKKSYEEANISPDKITYVELHGIGSVMLDSTEIEALRNVFTDVGRIGYCGIGSLTPNIGNLNPASGIFGLFKILLAFQNKLLPGTLNFNELPPFLNLDGSPFYIQRDLKRWEPVDEDGNRIPRMASLNGYGWGGGNAHFVIQEYKSTLKSSIAAEEIKPLLFILSGKDHDTLSEYITSILKFIELNHTLSMEDLVYTLQVGRFAMNTRFAIVFNDKSDLIRKIRSFLQYNTTTNYIFYNDMENDRLSYSNAQDKKRDPGSIDSLFKSGELDKIAQLWVSGEKIFWDMLYREETGIKRRTPLPKYPFKKTKIPILPVIDHKIKKRRIWKNPDQNEQFQDFEEQYSMEIEKIINKYLNIPLSEIVSTKNLKEYGLDSMIAMRIIHHIEKVSNRKIPLESFMQCKSIEDIKEILIEENVFSNENQVVEFEPNIKSPVNNKKRAHPIPSKQPGYNEEINKLLDDLIERKITPEQAVKIEKTIYN